MFEKFTSKDANDFRQRYMGTYGYFRNGKDKTLVRLDRVNVEGTKTVEFVDRNDLKYHIRADAEDDTVGFDFLPPKMAYHNTNSGTYLLKKLPARQFSRGLSERNMAIRTVLGIANTVDFQTLSDIFENPITVRQAIMRALSRNPKHYERSFAISNQFASNIDHKNIFCLGVDVGVSETSIKDGDCYMEIKLNDFSLWGTEIRDALNRAGIKGEVN